MDTTQLSREEPSKEKKRERDGRRLETITNRIKTVNVK